MVGICRIMGKVKHKNTKIKLCGSKENYRITAQHTHIKKKNIPKKKGGITSGSTDIQFVRIASSIRNNWLLKRTSNG
jgi:hypothetical protein